MKFFTIKLSIKQKCKYNMTTKIIYQFLFTFTVFCFTHLLTFLFLFSKTFDSFFGINKFVLDRNLKTINCFKIYTFPSYFASDDTVRKIHKLMDKLKFLGTCPTILYSTQEELRTCHADFLFLTSKKQKTKQNKKKQKKFVTNFGCPYVHVSMLSWDRNI